MEYHSLYMYLQTRGLRQTYNVNFDLEKGALTEQPCRSTRDDISPLDDIVFVTSEQRESRTKSRSDKRGLHHKVFEAHDTEPKLVGFRNTAYELAEVTPLRKEYVILIIVVERFSKI